MTRADGLLWADRTEVAGRVLQVRALAAGVGSYAEELAGCADRVRRSRHGLAAWRGRAADACRTALGDLAAGLGQSRDACRRAAEALASYAALLEDAQAEAAQARAMWREADRLTVDWAARQTYLTGVDATVTQAADDPGAERRGWARAVLGSAIERQDAAARVAARAVSDATNTLRQDAAPRLPGELAAYVGRDAREGFTAGVRSLVDTAAWVAQAPADPRSAAGDVVDSLAWTLTDPVAAAKQAVNWRDLHGGHPVRAVAELAPGVAAAYVTGGASKGLELSRSARHRPEPGEDLWTLPQMPVAGPIEAAGGEAAVRVRATLIAHGHAWKDHAGDWRALGLRSPAELAETIEDVMTDPTFWAPVAFGRTVYWDQSRGLFVVHNPNEADNGSAYVATDGVSYYFRNLAKYIEGKAD